MNSAGLIRVTVAVVVTTIAELAVDGVDLGLAVVAVPGVLAPHAPARVGDRRLLTLARDRRVFPLGKVAEPVAVAVFVPREEVTGRGLTLGWRAAFDDSRAAFATDGLVLRGGQGRGAGEQDDQEHVVVSVDTLPRLDGRGLSVHFSRAGSLPIRDVPATARHDRETDVGERRKHTRRSPAGSASRTSYVCSRGYKPDRTACRGGA